MNMNIKQEIKIDYDNTYSCLPVKKEVTEDENAMGTSAVNIKEEIINDDINRENKKNLYGHQQHKETGTYYHVAIKTEPINVNEHPETTAAVENNTRQRAYAPRAGGYNCTVCGDAFKWKKSLEQHMKKHETDDRQVRATTRSSVVTIKQEMDGSMARAYPLATPTLPAYIKVEPADYVSDADETQTARGMDTAEIVVKIKEEPDVTHVAAPLGCETERPITRPFEDIFKDKAQYRCNTCHITFRCENFLTSHMKTHKDKQYMCLVCGFESVSEKGMRNHEKSHTHTSTIKLNEEDIKYECTMCDFKTTQRKCLKAHERERHAGERFYECDYCGHRTRNKSSLSRHIRAHTGDLPCQCDYCDYKVLNKSTLLRHMGMHAGDKPYRCYVCGYRTETRNRLAIHKRKHTGETYSCTQCAFKSVSQLSLSWHQSRKHSDKKPHACSLCDYVAVKKARLREHMKKHTNEKPFGCSTCDFKTSYKTALALHFRTHTGDKPFECSMCNFKTAHIGTIKLHERTHTGEKPYACSMCNYKSAYLASFTRHERIHTGEKPFACSECDFKTRGQGNLKRHKRIHTGEKPFKCSVCNFKTAHRSSLTKHNQTVHM